MSTSRDSRIGLPPSIDSTMASSRARSWMRRATRKTYFARSRPGSAAEAEALRGEPVVAQRLLDQHEPVQRGLRGRDAARDLHADDSAGALRVVADGLEHDERHTGGRAAGGLAGRGLDEVGAGLHGEHRGVPNVVVGAELSGLD